ncbi:MAG: hypothetical protein UX68_C0022G0007 [Parcubacteria group bacterium GW2011_GWA2_46_9]|nr:MAG: hypothetical protein UX68_C0022G0007 [Parcubacteria group bacterium GW2011_GWA2_46_9]
MGRRSATSANGIWCYCCYDKRSHRVCVKVQRRAQSINGRPYLINQTESSVRELVKQLAVDDRLVFRKSRGLIRYHFRLSPDGAHMLGLT